MEIDIIRIGVYTAASVTLLALLAALLSLRHGWQLMLMAVAAVVPISSIVFGFFFMYLFSDL